MTTRRPTSARSDQPRTHRSQSKPAKAQPILLDRLATALERQNVSLKRAALQSVAAAAFGYHNANEFAAADLVPPPATVLGRVSLPQGDLILVQDPAGTEPYGLPDALLSGERAQAYGISPYGGLVDLSGIAADPAATTAISSAPVGAKSDQTIHVALIEGWHGTTTYFALDLLSVKAQVAQYCRSRWNEGPSDKSVDDFANDQEVITAFFDGHEVDDLSYGEIPVAKLPLALHVPPDAAARPAAVWIGVHDYDNGSTTYADTSEAGLYAQVAKVLRENWSEVERDAGPETDYPDDREAVEAYFEHSDEDTLDVTTHALPALGDVAPAPETDPDAAWRAHVAKIREDVEASYPWEGWAQHPAYDTESWQEAVANGDTREGYWEWLARTLEEAREEEAEDTEPESQPPASLEAWAEQTRTVVERIRTVNDPVKSGADEAEHSIYLRSDWSVSTMNGLTQATYATWVADNVRASRAQAEAWLTQDMTAKERQHLAQGCDAILRVPVNVKMPATGNHRTFRPGTVVRVTECGEPGQDYVTVTLFPNVQITFYADDRGGFVPLSLADTGAAREDRHPVYVHADWLAERNRGARAIDYPAWVAEHEREDVLRLQNWSQVPDLGTGWMGEHLSPPCTIHIHGVANLVDTEGEPTGKTTRYAPGDKVTLEEAEFMGANGTVTLETADGGRFTLDSLDRGGYLPITPIRKVAKIADADRALYPHADWVAEMKATGGGTSYAEWLTRQVRANTATDQAWLRPEDLKALPSDVRLTVHVHGRATIHDEIAGSVRTDYAAGDVVTMAGIDDRDPADIAVTLVTHDGGLFALRAGTRGGRLPISVVQAGQSDPFADWIAGVEREIAAPVSPQAYRPYFDQGLSPTEAVAADRKADGLDEAPDDDSADAFMWKVAEELGRSDLTHDAAFQEFCLNMHGDATPAQAAESWERR